LLFEGTPVAFFEAKGVDTDLNSDHREQLATYMKNENINWGSYQTESNTSSFNGR